MTQKQLYVLDHGDHAEMAFALAGVTEKGAIMLSSAELSFEELNAMADCIDEVLQAPDDVLEGMRTAICIGDARATVSYNNGLWIQLNDMAIAQSVQDAVLTLADIRKYLNTKIVTEDNASEEFKALRKQYEQPKGE